MHIDAYNANGCEIVALRSSSMIIDDQRARSRTKTKELKWHYNQEINTQTIFDNIGTSTRSMESDCGSTGRLGPSMQRFDAPLRFCALSCGTKHLGTLEQFDYHQGLLSVLERPHERVSWKYFFAWFLVYARCF